MSLYLLLYEQIPLRFKVAEVSFPLSCQKVFLQLLHLIINLLKYLLSFVGNQVLSVLKHGLCQTL